MDQKYASFFIVEEAMKKQKMSIYRLSKLSGVAESSIYAWKGQHYKPKIDKIKEIAKVLGLSYEQLI